MSFCFRKELSDSFTSALMQENKRTVNQLPPWWPWVLYLLRPHQARTPFLLVFLGSTENKDFKHLVSQKKHHFLFSLITAWTLHTANYSRSGVANFKRLCSLACALVKACCAQSVAILYMSVVKLYVLAHLNRLAIHDTYV